MERQAEGGVRGFLVNVWVADGKSHGIVERFITARARYFLEINKIKAANEIRTDQYVALGGRVIGFRIPLTLPCPPGLRRDVPEARAVLGGKADPERCLPANTPQGKAIARQLKQLGGDATESTLNRALGGQEQYRQEYPGGQVLVGGYGVTRVADMEPAVWLIYGAVGLPVPPDAVSFCQTYQGFKIEPPTLAQLAELLPHRFGVQDACTSAGSAR